MNGKKLVAILIIIFALIILIGLVYFMFLASVKEKKPEATAPTAEEQPAETAVKEAAPPPAPVRKQQVTEEDLKRLAASFVERYGSYSNQSGYANIRDLEIFMSQAMKLWARNYMEQYGSQGRQTDIYYGITTKAVVVDTKQFDDYAGQAEFTVKTQRQESTGVSANVRSFQQDASAVIIKEGGVWKIERVKWEE